MVQQQRVAIRRGARDATSGQRAARTKGVFHDDRLLERLRHALPEDPCHDVGRPAGRERDDEGDGFFRVVGGQAGA
jgi:hypothetical protein